MDELQRARNEGRYDKDLELPLIRRGEFKIAYNNEMVFLIIIGVIMIAVLIAVFPMISAITEDATRRSRQNTIYAVVGAIELVFGVFFAFVLMGRKAEYRAEETEFEVKGPGSKTEYFYYSDVQDVDFKPFKLFGNHRGYIVTVTTGIRTIEYRCVFSENKVFKDISGNPFYYLALNSGIITSEKPEVDSDGVESMFESMVVQQITEKNLSEMEEEKIRSTTRW